MNLFLEKGIKIPEQINIVGFSNWFMSSIISHSLTTVDQPGFKMGKKAFKILYKEMMAKKKNKNFDYKQVVLDTELVIRDSTNN